MLIRDNMKVQIVWHEYLSIPFYSNSNIFSTKSQLSIPDRFIFPSVANPWKGVFVYLLHGEILRSYTKEAQALFEWWAIIKWDCHQGWVYVPSGTSSLHREDCNQVCWPRWCEASCGEQTYIKRITEPHRSSVSNFLCFFIRAFSRSGMSTCG